jgi:hypothetical protein
MVGKEWYITYLTHHTSSRTPDHSTSDPYTRSARKYSLSARYQLRLETIIAGRAAGCVAAGCCASCVAGYVAVESSVRGSVDAVAFGYHGKETRVGRWHKV